MPTVPEPDTAARPQHYFFAHYTLREEVFKATDQLIAALSNQDLDYIRFRWFIAMAHCRMAGRPFDKHWTPIGEIQVYSEQQDEVACYVISMPEAKRITEAFFVAVVKTSGEVRYFTLEKGVNNEGPQTVFCEWTADGRHLNYGNGPAGTVEAVIERVFRQVNQDLARKV